MLPTQWQVKEVSDFAGVESCLNTTLFINLYCCLTCYFTQLSSHPSSLNPITHSGRAAWLCRALLGSSLGVQKVFLRWSQPMHGTRAVLAQNSSSLQPLSTPYGNKVIWFP